MPTWLELAEQSALDDLARADGRGQEKLKDSALALAGERAGQHGRRLHGGDRQQNEDCRRTRTNRSSIPGTNDRVVLRSSATRPRSRKGAPSPAACPPGPAATTASRAQPPAALDAGQVTEDQSREVQTVVSHCGSGSGDSGSGCFMHAARAAGRLRYHHIECRIDASNDGREDHDDRAGDHRPTHDR